MKRHKSLPGLDALNKEGGMRSPVFNRQTSESPRWFSVENKANSDTTEVYIMDEIGGWFGTTASDFIDEIKAISTPKISLHINSPGGEVFEGVAIYNALINHPAHVTVYVDALAASAASFIAQAGDEIIMSRGSTMMIHDGLAFCVGNEAEMLKTAGVLDKISNNIADLYAARAGGTAEDWRALMREEVWYTAQEAVDAGLADKVAEVVNKDAVAATNKWDLSVFNHAGRMDAPSPVEIIRKINNRAKEAPVGQKSTPRAEATETETEAPESTGPAVPAEQPGDKAPLPEVTEPEKADEPEPEETVEEQQKVEAEPSNSTGPHVQITNATSAFTVFVNGVATTDPKAVQAHITALETAQMEAKKQARKDFVASLASGNKISASQIEQMEAFAEGLSDAQYEAWKGVYDNAPALPILGKHSDGSNHGGDESQREAAVTDKIDVLKQVVAQHKLAGMSADKIKNTGSYKELMELQPTFKL